MQDSLDSRDSNSTDSIDSLDSKQDSHDSLQSYKKLNYDSLSDDEKQECYIFHILSDFVSQDSRTKLTNLTKDLSKIYPCEIQVHICDDTQFQGLPNWHNNYLMYFRLLVPQILRVKLCLYLDIDMLVLKDLRELFTLDLGDKVAGVVLDQLQFCFVHQSEYYYADEFAFHDFYFNSGLLLINLGAWQKQKIFQKATAFLRSYNAQSHDQDALNVAIRKENALILPLNYNIFALFFPQTNQSTYNLLNGFKIDYSQNEMRFALANPAIIHFACQDLKPWNFKQYNHILQNGQNIALLWWKIALQTPHFFDLLSDIFFKQWQEMTAIYSECKDEYSAKVAFKGYVANVIWQCSQSLRGYVKMPFVVWREFRDFNTKRDYAVDLGESNGKSCESLDKNLALKFWDMATSAWKKQGLNHIRKFALLPFRIFSTKRRCKKDKI